MCGRLSPSRGIVTGLNGTCVPTDLNHVLLYFHTRYQITEISYTYVSWMIHSCPGHWELEGTPGNDLLWVKGHMWPEHAQVEDFLSRLESVKESTETLVRHPGIDMVHCNRI